MQSLKRGWRAFSRVMERVGNFQARVLLTVFYLVIAAPFGLGVRVWSDPLRLQWRTRGQARWTDRPAQDVSLELARKQY